MVYRFRVTYEENEDIHRDIEIRANQNFNDLHYIIQQSISFDNSKPAYFYMSDDYWRKEEEIPLHINQEDKEKKGRAKKQEPPKRKVLADFVNDPHQKFIYVFDPEKEWTFQVELIKILPAEGNDYPKCVKSVGTSPKQYKENLPHPPPEEEEEEPKKIKDNKEALIEDAEEKAVEVADDEEIIALKSEEGEEPAEGEEEKPADEEEEGESSDGAEFDDED